MTQYWLTFNTQSCCWCIFAYWWCYVKLQVTFLLPYTESVLMSDCFESELKVFHLGASLVVQWLRICLPMQGTWVWALVREDPTQPWSGKIPHASEQLSLYATTTEARVPRARALQQEKPLQWEVCTPQRRVAPACHN